MKDIFVVNLKRDQQRPNSHREYCGRGSIWGNPYVINDNFNRDDVIRLFAKHFEDNFDKYEKDIYRLIEISKTRDVELSCFCYPKSCHCDIIHDKIIALRNLQELDVKLQETAEI